MALDTEGKQVRRQDEAQILEAVVRVLAGARHPHGVERGPEVGGHDLMVSIMAPSGRPMLLRTHALDEDLWPVDDSIDLQGSQQGTDSLLSPAPPWQAPRTETPEQMRIRLDMASEDRDAVAVVSGTIAPLLRDAGYKVHDGSQSDEQDLSVQTSRGSWVIVEALTDDRTVDRAESR